MKFSLRNAAFVGRLNASPVITPGAQTLAWAAQVVTNGGTNPTGSQLVSVEIFYRALVSAGIYNKFHFLNFIAPGPTSTVSHRTPFIPYSTVVLWPTSGGTLGGSVNGVQWLIGSNQYMNPGFNVNSFNATNMGMSFYGYTMANDAGPIDMGGFSNPNGAQFYGNFGNAVALDLAGSDKRVDWSSGLVHGFFSGSRSSASLARLYFANSSTPFAMVGENTGANATGLTNQTLACAGGISSGTAYTSMARIYSMFAAHQAFNDTETQAFYNAIQALRVAFGGGWR